MRSIPCLSLTPIPVMPSIGDGVIVWTTPQRRSHHCYQRLINRYKLHIAVRLHAKIVDFDIVMQPSATTHESGQQASAEQRRHQRYSVRIAALLHARGKTQPVMINDLSTGGAGIESVIGIYSDDFVELELECGRRISGTVIWWISGCCGVQFDQTLSTNDPLLIAVGVQGRK
jgi:PilZ domain